jgi:hypothetical protein
VKDVPIERGAAHQAHILKIVEPIWLSRNATAVWLRSRIENILDWAAVRKYRTGENPARWRGSLDKLLARPSRVHRVQHLAAMPYQDIPAFMAELRQQPGVAAKALEFVILTATRTGETIGAQWAEIEGNVWTIPATRMKSGREHRVPLSPPRWRSSTQCAGRRAESTCFLAADVVAHCARSRWPWCWRAWGGTAPSTGSDHHSTIGVAKGKLPAGSLRGRAGEHRRRPDRKSLCEGQLVREASPADDRLGALLRRREQTDGRPFGARPRMS